jgi:hypothetical protein
MTNFFNTASERLVKACWDGSDILAADLIARHGANVNFPANLARFFGQLSQPDFTRIAPVMQQITELQTAITALEASVLRKRDELTKKLLHEHSVTVTENAIKIADIIDEPLPSPNKIFHAPRPERTFWSPILQATESLRSLFKKFEIPAENQQTYLFSLVCCKAVNLNLIETKEQLEATVTASTESINRKRRF